LPVASDRLPCGNWPARPAALVAAPCGTERGTFVGCDFERRNAPGSLAGPHGNWKPVTGNFFL